MGNKEAKERAKQEVLERLAKGETFDPNVNAESWAEIAKKRVMLGKDILSNPAQAIAKMKGPITENIMAYYNMGKSNSELRKNRDALRDLVNEKLAKKSQATGKSIDELRRALASSGKKLKWDNQDTKNLIMGGPWGAIATGIRHKRQNDIYDLIHQFKQLQSEGYGKLKHNKRGGKKKR